MNKKLEIALQTHDLESITEHFIILCKKFNEQIINNNKSEIYDFFLELEEYKASESHYFNYLLITSAEGGFSNLLELLLNEKRVDPAFESNLSIVFANNSGFSKNVDLLWQEPEVKKSLLVDDEALYHACLKKDLKNKLSDF